MLKRTYQTTNQMGLLSSQNLVVEYFPIRDSRAKLVWSEKLEAGDYWIEAKLIFKKWVLKSRTKGDNRGECEKVVLKDLMDQLRAHL